MAVLQDGWKVIEVAEHLGVARQTIHRWIARHEAGGVLTASSSGTTPSRSNIPADVSPPSESRTSFAVKGTPCNKSTLSPLARDTSATRASSIARSRITTTTELTAPLTALIRSMNAWTTSTDETTRSCRRCEMASAPFSQSSCMVETLTGVGGPGAGGLGLVARLSEIP
jgi:hypothetical protein